MDSSTANWTPPFGIYHKLSARLCVKRVLRDQFPSEPAYGAQRMNGRAVSKVKSVPLMHAYIGGKGWWDGGLPPTV